MLRVERIKCDEKNVESRVTELRKQNYKGELSRSVRGRKVKA